LELKKFDLSNGESKVIDEAPISIMKSGGTAVIKLVNSYPKLGIVVEDEEGDEYILIIPEHLERSIVLNLLATMDDLMKARNENDDSLGNSPT
jgi:hypothetical protein